MKPHAIVGLTLNYRDAVRTERCVRSLLAEGAVHVVVWDNSGDGGTSATALQQSLDGCVASIVASDANLGFAAGANRGLATVAERFPGKAALLINNDAVLVPGACQAMCDALDANPHAKIVYPGIDHGGWVRGMVYYQRWTGLITDRRVPGSFAFPSGCCLMVNLPISGAALFDEDFFMYGEDWELGWRLSQTPQDMVHVPRVLVVHEGSASSKAGSVFYETRTVAGHLMLVDKIAENRIQKVSFLMMHAITLLLRSAVRAARYRSLSPLKALCLALANVRSEWKSAK